MAGEKVIVFIGGKKRYIPLPEATVSPAVVAQSVADYLVAHPPSSYTHPSTHPGSIITQDASHRFVSDTEKGTWNAGTDITGKVDKETGKSLVYDTSIADFHAPGSDKETAPSIAVIVTGATAQTAPLDADEFPFYKIVGTVLSKVTWANIKSTLSSIFQATLVSGTTIKTINSESLLGSGNIVITGSTTPTSWGKYF